MTSHDWIRLVSLGLRAAELANRTSKVPMVRREIIAPDGRRATFVVPASEAPSVSIARMYPGGVIPAATTQGTVHRDVQHSGSSSAGWQETPRPTPHLMGTQRGWIVLAGIVLVFVILAVLGRVDSSSQAPATTVPPAAPVAAVQLPTLPRVQLKTGANVRTGPSRTATVLRVAQRGEVFTKYGEANGWLHVGGTQPEGWVAQSVVAPAD